MTRLAQSVVNLNADVNETIQKRPNTIAKLTTERHFVVQERAQHNVDGVIAFRQKATPPGIDPGRTGCRSTVVYEQGERLIEIQGARD